MSFSRERSQRTLKKRVRLSGIGVHSGAVVSMTLCPSATDTGIRFIRRAGSEAPAGTEIPARWEAVGSTELCTVLGDPKGAFVATVEHLLAALAGLGIDNCLIDICGAEVPIMDGSAREFVRAIDRAGIAAQRAPRRMIRIDRPVRVEEGAAFAEFLPYEGLRFEIGIDYDCPVIGRQSYALDLTPDRFRREIAGARTYGYLRDVERMRAAGFARGSSLENSVVIGDGQVVNPDGLRHPDEFVRHKVLDTIGDLALAGMPIQGLFRSFRGGHRLNAMALSELLSREAAWTVVTDQAREPRSEARGVEHAAGMVAAAFAPEVL
jgi:UDP-3-O-[3-hydroxymyristoyl] N-acetylglucosamine deacetylase